MKKFLRWALALSLCLALSVCVALADEAPVVNVQLDGAPLVFTDAVPQVKDQRTFLPFRAVFEAMGAQVSNEGSVITAVRGDKTLTMTLDQTAATVAEKGKTTPITMDVAPYVDPTTWRTYVPVRFAAQAFGCSVGWDQDAYTAIIIDTDKLLDEALEGKSFAYLEKMNALEEKYETGIWDVSGSFDADARIIIAAPMTITGTMTGTTQDGDKMSMDMNMKMDMAKFVQALSSTGSNALDAEDLAVLEEMKTKGVDLTMRGDMTQGKLYMNMDMGALGEKSGFDPNTWYSMDMNALLAQSGSGMDWTTLLAQAKDIDYVDLAQMVLSAAQPDDAANDYTALKTEVEKIVTALSDQGFVAADNAMVSTYTFAEDEGMLTVKLTLNTEGETVKGYAMDFAMSAQAEGQTMGMSMNVAMDDQDKMKATFNMDLAGLMTMDMTMDGHYTPGTTAPVTTPPEGATVVDYMEMLGAQLGETDSLGVIGGADGPTAIITTAG